MNYAKQYIRPAAFLLLLLLTLVFRQANAQTGSLGTISGPSPVNAGTTSAYSVTPKSNATYSWNVNASAGTVIGSGAAISIQWKSAFTGNTTISCTATDPDFNIWSSSKSITVQAAASTPVASTTYPVDTTITGTITGTIHAQRTIEVIPEAVIDAATGTVELLAGDASVCPCYPLASLPNANQNYIRTLTPRKAFSNADSLRYKQTCEVMESIQYFDGLGRPLQTIQVKGNSDATKDVVQLFAYDAYGREQVKYLPYASVAADGSYKSDAIAKQLDFYYPSGSGASGTQQTGTGIVVNPHPYSVTNFESSPLSRPLEQGAPGDAWQLSTSGIAGSGHTQRIDYRINDGNIPNKDNLSGFGVAQYSADIDATGNRILTGGAGTNYAAGTLNITITKDENWSSGKLNTVEEYKDNEGHVVLKRTFNHNDATGLDEVLSTYYVYDDLGNLSFVLPPGANPDNTTSAISQAALDNLCYQYRYDGRNRVTQKKVPGKGWEYTVYNNLDQVVFTQDSVQRANHQWGWIKYDEKGRVILTGIENNNTLTPDGVKGYVNSLTGQLWEDRTNSRPEGYTIYTHPQAGEENGNIRILTINFYDDYTATGLPSGAALPSAYAIPATASSMTNGLPTATKIAILNSDGSISNKMLWTVHYYDNKARVIKTYNQHYLGGTFDVNNYDEISSSYDFSNQVTYTKRQHHTAAAAGATTLTVANTIEYDHMNRKIRSWEKIGSADSVVISQLAFNEVGQLLNKKLHSTDGSSFLQTLKYAYNERGWLRRAGSSSGLFNMELRYNDSTDVSVSKVYNGNISQMLYNTTKVTTPGNRTFSYTYDKLNRLTIAGFSGGTTGDALNEAISYDVMGNITQLTRGGTGGGTMNYTSYTGNQLNTVTGYSPRSYAYDGNGNATSDGSGKSISYNMLNLPRSVDVGSTNKATYTYDAAGQKLRNTGSDGNWDYIDGIVYHNGTIAFVNTEEGRAELKSGTYNYEYNLKDHLGNNRVSFDSNGGTARVIQEDEYYSFGLRKPTSGYDFSNNNRYLYNGKEIQTDLVNQYDYGARFYDPVIARWTSVDPLAEKMRRYSPYNYGFDNPIRFTDPDGMGPTDWVKIPITSTETTTESKFVWDANVHSTADAQKQYGAGATDVTANGNYTYTGSNGKEVQLNTNGSWDYTYGEMRQPINNSGGEELHALQAGIQSMTPLLNATATLSEVVANVAIPGGGAAAEGEGLISKGISKIFGSGADAGTGRVFWSGGKEAMTAAADYAANTGGKTLEMTTGGKIMSALNPILPRSISNPIWDRLSAGFAKGATGAVDAFQDVNGVRIESTWARIEYGILKANNINITFHPVIP